MVEFKIIKLPEKTEEEEPEVEEKSLREIDEDYQPPKKRWMFLIILILIVAIALIIIKVLTTYDDYQVEKTLERNDSVESIYCDYKGNMLKYSPDGVSCNTYDGSLVWNYTYDMVNPNMDMCEDYIVVYDKKGSEVCTMKTERRRTI